MNPSEINVSVVMAVKNEEKHVVDAVDSILSQMGVLVELILVDDHSTDNTNDLLKMLERQHSNMRVVQNPRRGKVAAFNYGCTLARGKFVCLFAGDDIMPQGSLVERLSAVQDYPEISAVVCLCKVEVMSDDPRKNGQIIPRKSGKGATCGVSPLMNRKVMERFFPVPEQLPNEDTWLALCVTFLPDLIVVHSDIIGCKWRMHSGNSINILESFSSYSRKLALRYEANQLFLDQYSALLSKNSKNMLASRIAIERWRVSGKWLRIIIEKAPAVERLRALFFSSPLLYAIRRRSYRIFSGW